VHTQRADSKKSAGNGHAKVTAFVTGQDRPGHKNVFRETRFKRCMGMSSAAQPAQAHRSGRALCVCCELAWGCLTVTIWGEQSTEKRERIHNSHVLSHPCSYANTVPAALPLRPLIFRSILKRLDFFAGHADRYNTIAFKKFHAEGKAFGHIAVVCHLLTTHLLARRR
jgi:hypothetical protein